jgi:hypothetical protein
MPPVRSRSRRQKRSSAQSMPTATETLPRLKAHSGRTRPGPLRE